MLALDYFRVKFSLLFGPAIVAYHCGERRHRGKPFLQSFTAQIPEGSVFCAFVPNEPVGRHVAAQCVGHGPIYLL